MFAGMYADTVERIDTPVLVGDLVRSQGKEKRRQCVALFAYSGSGELPDWKIIDAAPAALGVDISHRTIRRAEVDADDVTGKLLGWIV